MFVRKPDVISSVTSRKPMSSGSARSDEKTRILRLTSYGVMYLLSRRRAASGVSHSALAHIAALFTQRDSKIHKSLERIYHKVPRVKGSRAPRLYGRTVSTALIAFGSALAFGIPMYAVTIVLSMSTWMGG
ncbi:hypothetical protein F5B21DRAFT_505753 [Xylaria acuta]|nr:hypothetical protein F5B21DRAFT_505753 [Xylaria acuta]